MSRFFAIFSLLPLVACATQHCSGKNKRPQATATKSETPTKDKPAPKPPKAGPNEQATLYPMQGNAGASHCRVEAKTAVAALSDETFAVKVTQVKNQLLVAWTTRAERDQVHARWYHWPRQPQSNAPLRASSPAFAFAMPTRPFIDFELSSRHGKALIISGNTGRNRHFMHLSTLIPAQTEPRQQVHNYRLPGMAIISVARIPARHIKGRWQRDAPLHLWTQASNGLYGGHIIRIEAADNENAPRIETLAETGGINDAWVDERGKVYMIESDEEKASLRILDPKATSKAERTKSYPLQGLGGRQRGDTLVGTYAIAGQASDTDPATMQLVLATMRIDNGGLDTPGPYELHEYGKVRGWRNYDLKGRAQGPIHPIQTSQDLPMPWRKQVYLRYHGKAKRLRRKDFLGRVVGESLPIAIAPERSTTRRSSMWSLGRGVGFTWTGHTWAIAVWDGLELQLHRVNCR